MGIWNMSKTLQELALAAVCDYYFFTDRELQQMLGDKLWTATAGLTSPQCCFQVDTIAHEEDDARTNMEERLGRGVCDLRRIPFHSVHVRRIDDKMLTVTDFDTFLIPFRTSLDRVRTCRGLRRVIWKQIWLEYELDDIDIFVSYEERLSPGNRFRCKYISHFLACETFIIERRLWIPFQYGQPRTTLCVCTKCTSRACQRISNISQHRCECLDCFQTKSFETSRCTCGFCLYVRMIKLDWRWQRRKPARFYSGFFSGRVKLSPLEKKPLLHP